MLFHYCGELRGNIGTTNVCYWMNGSTLSGKITYRKGKIIGSFDMVAGWWRWRQRPGNELTWFLIEGSRIWKVSKIEHLCLLIFNEKSSEWNNCRYLLLTLPQFCFCIFVLIITSAACFVSLSKTYFELLRQATTTPLVVIYMSWGHVCHIWAAWFVIYVNINSISVKINLRFNVPCGTFVAIVNV